MTSLADASLSYSGLSTWRDSGLLPEFLGLAAATWRTRAYGDFWSHVMVAEGAVDISAETDVKLWDLAALQVIVEEAGGVFTDLDGRPVPDGGSAVCTNGLLHARRAEPAGAGRRRYRAIGEITPGGLSARRPARPRAAVIASPCPSPR